MTKVGRPLASTKNIDKELKKLYYDEGNQFGIIKFYKLVQRRGLPYSRKSVIDWLRKQEVYQLTKPTKKSRGVQSVRANTAFKVLEADLTDYKNVKLLTVIDVFSKYAFVKRIKNKTAEVVAAAFEDIFDEIDEIDGERTRRLLTDNGGEFKNEVMTETLLGRKIKQSFNQAYSPAANGIIERFNGTFKRMLQKGALSKRFVVSPGHKYIKDTVNRYNDSYHTSIGMTPYEAILPENKEEVTKKRDKKGFTDKRDKDDIIVGDTVRRKRKKETFEKGTINWSKEKFIVYKILRPLDPRKGYKYKIKDTDGDKIIGFFGRRDLQKVYT